MTEIEFLVQLILNEQMSDSLRATLLGRIDEIEKSRLATPIQYPFLQPYPAVQPINIQIPYVDPTTCFHEFPIPWHGLTAPPCKKCGTLAGLGTFFVTSSNSSSNLKLVE